MYLTVVAAHHHHRTHTHATTARQHSTYRQHRTHRRPALCRASPQEILPSEFVGVRMWAEWWPTGARPDVAAGVLEGAHRGSGGARVVVLRSVSIVVSVDERQR